MPAPTLVPLPRATGGEDYHVAPHKRLEGDPLQTVWMDYVDPTGQFQVGVWRSEPGKWRVAYTEEEYCHVLEGRSVITDESGHAVTVSAGDGFVIPAGFVGTWEVLQTTTKRFVIHEAAAGAG